MGHNPYFSEVSRMGLLHGHELSTNGGGGQNRPYGRAYKPVEESAEACGDRILHLWKDWGLKRLSRRFWRRSWTCCNLQTDSFLGTFIKPWPMGKWPWKIGLWVSGLGKLEKTMVMIKLLSLTSLLLSLSRALVHWTLDNDQPWPHVTAAAQ